MTKRSKFSPKAFESSSKFLPIISGHIQKDTSANIYNSMLLSPAFQDLTATGVRLYLYMKARYYAEKKTDALITEYEKLTNQNINKSIRFTFNKAVWHDLYHIYSNGGGNNFQKDLNSLIDQGFITKIQSGKLTKSKSIYEFSDKWVNWKK